MEDKCQCCENFRDYDKTRTLYSTTLCDYCIKRFYKYLIKGDDVEYSGDDNEKYRV